MVTSAPRIIVFQHIACEHPGIFRSFMAEDGIDWDAVELDEGERIPDLSKYDAMISMGGPMDVWQEEQFPWIAKEKEAIHEAVSIRKIPFMGVCLGHQMLAEALGGKVGLAKEGEVGMLNVEMTKEGANHPLMHDIPAKFKTLQWHGAEVKKVPENSTVLVQSSKCAVQAFAVGETAFGIQFHIETGPDTVDEWNAVPEYNEALKNTFGAGGADHLRAEAEKYDNELREIARTLYKNWTRCSF